MKALLVFFWGPGAMEYEKHEYVNSQGFWPMCVLDLMCCLVSVSLWLVSLCVSKTSRIYNVRLLFWFENYFILFPTVALEMAIVRMWNIIIVDCCYELIAIRHYWSRIMREATSWGGSGRKHVHLDPTLIPCQGSSRVLGRPGQSVRVTLTTAQKAFRKSDGFFFMCGTCFNSENDSENEPHIA